MATLRLAGTSVPTIVYKIVAARNLKSLNVFELQPAFNLEVEEIKNAADLVICNEFDRLKKASSEHGQTMGLILYPIQGHEFGSGLTGKHECGTDKGIFIIYNNIECFNYVRAEIRKFIHSLYTKHSPARRNPYMTLDFTLAPMSDLEAKYPSILAVQDQEMESLREDAKKKTEDLSQEAALRREMESQMLQFSSFIARTNIANQSKSYTIQSVGRMLKLFRKLSFGTITPSNKYIVRPFGNPNVVGPSYKHNTWYEQFRELQKALDWIAVKEWVRASRYMPTEFRSIHVHFKFNEKHATATKFVANVRIYPNEWRAVEARMILARCWDRFRSRSSFSSNETDDYKLVVYVEDGKELQICTTYMPDNIHSIKADAVLFHQMFLFIKQQNRSYKELRLAYPDVNCVTYIKPKAQ